MDLVTAAMLNQQGQLDSLHLETNKSIHDAYKIDFGQQLGKGFTSRVMKAYRRSDRLDVAVKLIPKKAFIDQHEVQLLHSEITSLRALDHPNVLKLYDAYSDAFNYYLALEYVSGGELFDRIAAKVYYNEQEGRELCRCVLEALRHCHARDVCHRDIKPENLLMASKTDDVTVKLCDFGFASHCPGQEDALSGYLGSPIYMAPEVVRRSGHYGKGIDMWSFGVMVFIVLSGYPPFYDKDMKQLEAAILAGRVEFHEEYWRPVSAEAQDFILACLQVDPRRRITAEEASMHGWLDAEAAALLRRDLRESLPRLREFNARRKIKAAVHSVIALRRLKGRLRGLQARRAEECAPALLGVATAIAQATIPSTTITNASPGGRPRLSGYGSGSRARLSASSTGHWRSSRDSAARLSEGGLPPPLRGMLWVRGAVRPLRRYAVLEAGALRLYAAPAVHGTPASVAESPKHLRKNLPLAQVHLSLHAEEESLALLDCLHRPDKDLFLLFGQERKEEGSPGAADWLKALQLHTQWAHSPRPALSFSGITLPGAGAATETERLDESKVAARAAIGVSGESMRPSEASPHGAPPAAPAEKSEAMPPAADALARILSLPRLMRESARARRESLRTALSGILYSKKGDSIFEDPNPMLDNIYDTAVPGEGTGETLREGRVMARCKGDFLSPWLLKFAILNPHSLVLLSRPEDAAVRGVPPTYVMPLEQLTVKVIRRQRALLVVHSASQRVCGCVTITLKAVLLRPLPPSSLPRPLHTAGREALLREWVVDLKRCLAQRAISQEAREARQEETRGLLAQQ